MIQYCYNIIQNTNFKLGNNYTAKNLRKFSGDWTVIQKGLPPAMNYIHS